LEQLEEEERLREEAGYYAVPKLELDETLLEIRNLARKIRERKAIMRQETRVETSSKPTMPRTAPSRARERSVSNLRDKMEDLGVTMDGTDEVSEFLVAQSRFFFRTLRASEAGA
jgi:nucleolar GTP-binding protein